MANRLFSVIIPTYNRAYVLWKALLSVVNQDYYNWEAIVVDNGSTDDTFKLVKEFKEKRIKYIRQENLGPCIARNNGLKEARGDFVCYLDSDNEFRSDYLYYLNEHLDFRPNARFGICNQNVRWELYDDDWDLVAFAEESSSFGDEISLEQLIERSKRFDANSLFHVNVPQIAWEPRVKYLHDWELMIRLAKEFPEGFMYIPLSLVKYYSRYGKDGMCANVTYREWQEDYIAIWELHRASKMRPSDEWFKEKIRKYDVLIAESGGDDVGHRVERVFGRRR